MRIIAGRHRRRRLAAPPGARVRPTTDRLRETLFNILVHGADFAFGGARVADIFAGTGALGLEALSRGAEHITFVDNHGASVALIDENIAALHEQEKTRVLKTDARHLPATDQPYNLIFLDPPYRKDLLPPTLATLQDKGWCRPGSLIVAEFGSDETPTFPAGFTEIDSRAQGDAKFVILRMG